MSELQPLEIKSVANSSAVQPVSHEIFRCKCGLTFALALYSILLISFAERSSHRLAEHASERGSAVPLKSLEEGKSCKSHGTSSRRGADHEMKS